MKEIYGNAWDLFNKENFKILFITTNGTVKHNREGVMGRGIAKECNTRYSGSAEELGRLISTVGNRTQMLWACADDTYIYTFPVKHNWYEEADIELIKRSCREAVAIAPYELFPNHKFLLPRPGCGNGKLNWEDVKPVIEPLLDDRFYIVHFKEGE